MVKQVKESGMKMNWNVTICEVENGYLVKVGCKYVVFSSMNELLEELRLYMEGEPSDLIGKVKKSAGLVREDGQDMEPSNRCDPPERDITEQAIGR